MRQPRIREAMVPVPAIGRKGALPASQSAQDRKDQIGQRNSQNKQGHKRAEISRFALVKGKGEIPQDEPQQL